MTEGGGTPSQTVGPFLHIGLLWADGNLVVARGSANAIVIRGTLYDGAGDPVPDGLVETWQADPAGRFAHPDDPRGPSDPFPAGFLAFGRCATDSRGNYEFVTLKPGALHTPDGGSEAPHINVSVFGRGLLDRVVTRIYFPDEHDANAADPVLCTVDERRRATLIAVPSGDDLVFDIRLQGENETVFFAV